MSFYNQEQSADDASLNLNPDRALSDLIALSKKNTKSNDDLVFFQALLQKWTETLIAQRSHLDDVHVLDSSKKVEYQRIRRHNRPTLMMCMLNTHMQSIQSNRRMALCGTPDGRVFSVGKDFRVAPDGSALEDYSFGTPRMLPLKTQITQMTVGRDHAVLLSKDGDVFTLGSNQWGQLGVGSDLA